MSAPAKDRTAVPDALTREDVLEVFCDRAKALFERQQQRVSRLEEDLSQQIETAIEEINSRHALDEQREEQFSQLDTKLAQLSRERDQALAARGEAESLLDEARAAISQVSHEQHDLRVQLSQCHKQLNARADELQDLRTRLRNSTGTQASDRDDQLARWEAERDALHDQLDQARQQLANADSESTVDASELDELRQRFETAVQEIRELKKKNSELNDQLANLRKRSKPDEEIPVGGFDWEAQKRRLMMQLESDFDTSDATHASDRLTVEGTIRITDQVIADKDRELKELKQRLENQSSCMSDAAFDAAATAGLLDQDEVIRQERENLKRLQEEWRNKLSQAEIDISVERARLGRERTELQSQMQKIDQQRQVNEAFAGGETADDKQPRGLWLKRLGLKDE